MADLESDIRHLRDAVRRRPHEVAQQIWLLAAMAMKSGLASHALRAFRKIYDWRPLWTQLHYDVIVYWVDRGENVEVLLDRFSSEDEVVFRYAYGLTLQSGAGQERAIEVYRDLLSREPGFAVARHNLALAYRLLDRRDAMIAEELEAVRLEPRMAEPHYVLGAHYATAHDLEKEREHTQKYLELAYPYLEKHTATAEMSLAFTRQAMGEGPFTDFLRQWRPR